MHPLIAFFAFIFSPSEDWLLKQAFVLVLEPSQLLASAESYDQIAQHYPTKSADAHAMMVWSEVLRGGGAPEAATDLMNRLLQSEGLATSYEDDIRLRLGELALKRGDTDDARQQFEKVVAHAGARSVDAQINLVLVDVASGNQEGAKQQAETLVAALGQNIPLNRAHLPLGLAAFVNNQYDQAIQHLAAAGEDPSALYFNALAHRRSGQTKDAIAMFEKIKRGKDSNMWSDLADFQLAETYFALGDDRLSRLVCQRAIDENPTNTSNDKYLFRLATLDMRSGKHEDALARLSPLLNNQDYRDRSAVLVAESLAKTEESDRLFKMLARGKPKDGSALSLYQTAWAASFDNQHDQAIKLAEQGLENFLDPTLTPRLLLLQALAYEHLNQEADALATYQTIIDRFPNTAAAAQSLHWTMLAYARAGRWKEAVTHGTYAWNLLSTEIQKENPDPLYWIGESHLQLKRYEDADRSFDNFLTLAPPKHALAHHAEFQRSVTLAHLNRPTAALAMLDNFSKSELVAYNPDWKQMAVQQRGHILFNQGRYELAIAAYRAGNGTAKSIYYEGLALYRLDYFSDAVQTWARAAQDHKESTFGDQSAFRMARTEFELGRATEAVIFFARYIENYPTSPRVQEARLQSAHAMFNSGDYETAAALYASYLSRYSTMNDKVIVAPYLAMSYARLGKEPDEVASLMKGLPPTETLASLQWEKGATAYNQKAYVQSDSLFAQLLSGVPTHDQSLPAIFYRGESHFAQSQWRDAQDAYTNYLTYSTETAHDQASLALFHKAVALYQQDKLLKAARTFESLLDQYPSDSLADSAKENLALCYHGLGDFTNVARVKEKFGPASTPTLLAEQVETTRDIHNHATVYETNRTGVQPIYPEKMPLARNAPAPNTWGE